MFFFFKQKSAYEMRISDWSSDVCSSDLIPLRKSLQLFYAPHSLRRSILKEDIRLDRKKEAGGTRSRGGDFYLPFWSDVKKHISGDGDLAQQIGRASCRERVCQYV